MFLTVFNTVVKLFELQILSTERRWSSQRTLEGKYPHKIWSSLTQITGYHAEVQSVVDSPNITPLLVKEWGALGAGKMEKINSVHLHIPSTPLSRSLLSLINDNNIFKKLLQLDVLLCSKTLTCCSGLKNPSFSHHWYQLDSTYSGLYWDGSSKVVSARENKVWRNTQQVHMLVLQESNTSDSKSITFFCPGRCVSSVLYLLLLTPFHCILFSSL